MTKRFEDLKLGDYVNFGRQGIKRIIAEDIVENDKMKFVFESDLKEAYALKNSKFIKQMVVMREYGDCDKFEWISNIDVESALQNYPQGEC